jgi:hypothetical protein
MARRDDEPAEPPNRIVRRLATFPVRFLNRTVHVTVPVDWPESIHHDGKTYYQTGKLGHRLGDQAQAAEYEAVDGEGRRTGERVWLLDDGTITED